MGIFDNGKKGTTKPATKTTKTVTMVRSEACCCQCHKKLMDIYTKPEDKESFRDNFIICPPCFVELCEKVMAANEK
jgi:uncharacterized CHY-type Zn-finger protein